MSDFDLNLLHVFNLLYEEGSVTKAAARLRLTQSAVSHALARLRDMLGDPLFVKIPNGLRPTERAHQLAPKLRIAFADTQSAVRAPVFDPATSNRRFRIAASAYFNGLTVSLIGLMRRQAPHATVQVTNESLDQTLALDQQQIDIVLGGFEKVPTRFRSEVLFQDELVWVIGANNPLARQRLDQKTLLAQPRLAVATTLPPDGTAASSRDELVRITTTGLGIELDAAEQSTRHMLVHDIGAAIAIVAATDMVALLPRGLAKIYANAHPIKIIEFPKGKLAPIEITMTWHSRFHEEPGSIWLRQAIRDAVKLATDGARHGRGRLMMNLDNASPRPPAKRRIRS